MESKLNRLNRFFENSHDVLRKHRLIVWSVFILIFAVALVGTPRIKIDMTMESFFKENDPVKELYDVFRDSFGSDDSLYIVYEAKDGDIFSDASLNALRSIQNKLENPSEDQGQKAFAALDHVVEVKTLINVSYLEAGGDTLISREFIGDNPPTSDDEREKLRKQALKHRDYPQFYLSKDSKYGGIWIRTDFGVEPVDDEEGEASESFDEELEDEEAIVDEPSGKAKYKLTTMQEYADFNRAMEKIILQPEYTDVLTFYPVGNSAIMGFFNDVINTEVEVLLSIALLLIMIVLFFLFRSFSAVLWPICIVVFTSILTIGLAGWLDVTMSMMVGILLMLILVVGVADSVHIMSGYLYFRTQKREHKAAIRAVLRRSGLACLLTSVTTSIGMVAPGVCSYQADSIFWYFRWNWGPIGFCVDHCPVSSDVGYMAAHFNKTS